MTTLDKQLIIAHLLFLLDCCFKHSLLALTAAAVVEKTLKTNETSLLLPVYFYYFNISYRIEAVVQGGVFVQRVTQREGSCEQT